MSVCQFAMTGGVASQHGGLPVMLSAEGAAAFDMNMRFWLGGIAKFNQFLQ